MSSIRYINQSAPFWDFVASLEDQGTSHPFFANNPAAHFFGGALPHHGGRPNPNNQPAGQDQAQSSSKNRNATVTSDDEDDQSTPTNPAANGEKTKANADGDGDDKPRDGNDGNSPVRGRAGCRSRRYRQADGFCTGQRGALPFAQRGGWWDGPQASGFGSGRSGMPGTFPNGAADVFNPIAHIGAFLNALSPNGNNSNDKEKTDSGDQDFRPAADVYDTPSAYVVHLSLPGAQKPDIGVNWDADKSELSIAGVVHRGPNVDEEMLQHLALDERKVGAFERKIRLGTVSRPAKVEVDGIAARLEEGVLVVEVPKEDAEYVQVRKVDVL